MHSDMNLLGNLMKFNNKNPTLTQSFTSNRMSILR